MNTTRRWGIVLALVTALISGVSVYVNTFAVRAIGDPTAYTTAKNAVAALLLLAVVATGRPAGVRLTRPDGPRTWLGLATIGVIGGSVPFVLFFTGLARTQAPQAAFLHKTLVLWVALLAVALLRERLGAAHGVAIALLLAGQWLLGGGGLFALDPGGWLILAATGLWSVETVLARRLLAGVSSWTLAVARMGLGSVLLLGWCALTGRLTVLAGLTPVMWGWILLTGVLLAGYVATWFAALARAQAVDVTAVLVLGAVVTSVIDTVVGGAATAPLAPVVLILAGVALVAWTMLRRPARTTLAAG